jgi:hypothetical protein
LFNQTKERETIMDNLQFAPVTMALGLSAIAAGTTSTLSSTGVLPYAIRGKAFSRAAMANQATPTTDATTGLSFTPLTSPPNASTGGQGGVFVVGYDAAGALRVSQGTPEQLDTAGNFINAPRFPVVVADAVCPIGYIVVRLGPTAVANWTFGISNLSGVTGVTYSFVSIVGLPDRPQIA